MEAAEINIALATALATPGWMDPEELQYLAHISYSLPIGASIVEVGSYKGRSACALALNPDITLYCVDLWQNYDGFGGCYPEFRKNTAHLPNVVPVMQSSLNAAEMFAWERKRFHAVFIDADHTEVQVNDDIYAWRPLLIEDGILFGHDFGRADHPGVEIVVKQKVPNYRVVPNTTIWTTEGV